MWVLVQVTIVAIVTIINPSHTYLNATANNLTKWLISMGNKPNWPTPLTHPDGEATFQG